MKRIWMVGMVISAVACGQADPNGTINENQALSVEASHVVCVPSTLQQDQDQNGISDVCQKQALQASGEGVLNSQKAN